ncbi:hypothetical protein GYRE_00830 [Yokenella regensburgei ATCC 49455]|nr:hypothetical protein GYRE_00830 [Yokenella regensburgei ATCC 49455]
MTVKVMPGCIVLMTFGEQEQKMPAEIKLLKQKLSGIESALR